MKRILISILVLIASFSLYMTQTVVYSSGPLFEVYLTIDGDEDITKEKVEATYYAATGDVEVELRIRSLTGQVEDLAALEFIIVPNDLITGLSDFASAKKTSGRNEVDIWNGLGTNYNTHKLSLAAVSGEDDGNVDISPSGTLIGSLYLLYNISSNLDNFRFQIEFSDAGYFGPSGIVTYPEDVFQFDLKIGTPVAGPDATLKSLNIKGASNTVYENSVDNNVDDSKELTISYADSQSELIITPNFNGSNSSTTVKVNGVLYTQSTKLNNNDVLTIEVSDTVGSETVDKTYTRVIKVTPASTNTNINVTTNKNSYVTKNSFDGNQTYQIEVNFSVTEIDVLVTASDTKATLSAAVSGTTTLNYTLLEVGVAQTKTVTITAESGAVKTYNIVVTRLDGDSNTDATIKVNNSATSYDSSLDAYVYTIPQSTTNYSMLATPLKSTTKIYYSEDGNSFSQTALVGVLQKGASQTLFVKAVSENGTEEIYTVVVSREKSTNTEIEGIQIQELPTFQPISSIPNAAKTIFTYTLRDLSSSELIVSVQEKLGENQTVQFLNSERQAISTIIQVDSLEYGNNTFYVVVTAQNGSTQKEYQLVIVKQSDEREIVSIEIQDREKGLVTIDPSKYVITSSGNAYSIQFNFELTNKVKVIITTSDYSTIIASGATSIIGNKAYFDKDFTSTAMQTIILGTITVKAQNNVSTEYSVELIRDAADSDNKLANININNIDLPNFLSTKYNGYELFVIDRNSNSFYIDAIANSSKATIEYFVNGTKQSTNQIGITSGARVTVDIRVTSQAGTTVTYSVTIGAQNDLNTITNITFDNISADKFTFDAGTNTYNVTVPYSISMVNAVVTASPYAVITGAGEYSLTAKSTRTLTIYATSESGKRSANTYTISIYREEAKTFNSLETLELEYNGEVVTLIPGTSVTQFEHRVDFAIDKVTVRATIEGSQGEKIVGVNGNTFEQLYNIPTSISGQTVTITVVGENNSTKVYQVRIYRANTISTIDSVVIDGQTYNVSQFVNGVLTLPSVAYSKSSMMVEVNKTDAYATVSTLPALISGVWNFTSSGDLELVINVTAQDGITKSTYKIQVNRQVAKTQNTLAELEVLVTYEDGTIDLMDGFSLTDAQTYNLRVNRNITSVIIKAYLLTSDMSSINGWGTPTISGNYKIYSKTLNLLNEGQTTSETISVFAEDPNTAKNDYRINVTRKNDNNDIDHIKVEAGSTLIFEGSYEDFIALNPLYNFPSSINSVLITVTKADQTARVSYNGVYYGNNQLTAQFTVNLIEGQNKTFQFNIETDVLSTESQDFKSTIVTAKYNRAQAQSDTSIADIKAILAGTDYIELQDEFDPTKSNYEIRVNRGTSSVDLYIYLDPTKYSTLEGMSFTDLGIVNGLRTYYRQISFTSVQYGTIRSVEFLIKAENGASKSYTIDIYNKNANVDITDLLINNNSINFDKDVFNYDLGTFEYSVSAINLALTRSDIYSKVTINGVVVSSTDSNILQSINLAVGMNKTFSIVIETEMNQVDNEALGYKKLTYTFTYDREAPSVNADLDSLQAIVTINGNPVDLLENLFLPTKLSYEVFVERSVGQVLLNASSSHNATISNLGTKPLASTEHVFEIAVKAEDGVTTKTYVVKIIRKDSNNKILDIGIDGISTQFEFNPSTLSYDLGNVPWNQDSITFDVILESNFATVSLNGTQTLKEGLNTYKVFATSERGQKGVEYTFTLTKETAYKDVDLASLVIKDAVSNKNFSLNYTPGTYNYTIEVNNEQRVNIIPTLKNTQKQSIQSDIDLSDIFVTYNQDGTVNQVISFKVIAQGVEQTYTIRLFKGVTLSNNNNFELSIYDLYNTSYLSTFDLAITEYSINLPYVIDKLTFDVRLEHNKAKVVYVKSVPQSFKDGTTSVVEFYVEAEDGSRTLTYKVNVTRAMASTENKLSDLVLTVNNEKILGKTNALNTFSEDVFTYNITLNENYTNALITYVKKVSSQEVSGPVNLQQTLKHGNNQFIIVVTPEDKEGLKGTYTINITIKNSDIELTNLSIDGLTFNYDSNTDTYDLGTVDGRFENINIVGTLSDSYGKLEGIGNKTLVEGLNTFIIKAISEDGSKELIYTIQITLTYSNDIGLSSVSLKDENNTNYLQFNQSTYIYNIEVPHNVTSLTLSATPTHANSQIIGLGSYAVELNKQTIINFYVVAENGDESEPYVIYVTRKSNSMDATLKSITIRDLEGNVLFGLADLNPIYDTFNPSRTNITLNLDRSYQEVIIDAELNDSNADMFGSLGDQLLDAGKNVFYIYTTAEDGKTKKTYTITINVVNKDIELLNLSVVNFPFTESFNKDISTYTLVDKIPATVGAVNVIGLISDPYGTITGLGIQPVYSGLNSLTITINSENGLVTKTYVINYEKEALSNNPDPVLSNDAELYDVIFQGLKNSVEFEFNPSTLTYYVEISYEDHQFYLEALAHAKATISGKGFYSIQPGQSEQIKVQVTAEDGTKGAIYTFNVSRKNASNENQLLDLFVIVNGVRTNLDVNLKSYVITVPIDITSITIGAIAPEFATVYGLGNKSLIDNQSIFSVTVVAENNDLETYNIQVIKVSDDASLKSLEVYNFKTGELLPFSVSFDKNIHEYYITLNASLEISDIEIMAVANYPYATIYGTGVKNLKSGIGQTTDRFDVVITAQDGQTKETYTIIIERNINPDDSLIIDNMYLSGDGVIYLGNDRHPNAIYQFTQSNKTYTVLVPYALKSVNLTVTNKEGASITGVGSYELNDQETLITFTITSKSGKFTNTYSILVVKEEPSDNNNLKDIKINGLSIEGFDSEVTSYEITVDEATFKSITLLAELEDTKSTLSGNVGTLVISAGKNSFNITVTAENGDKKTYSITINALSYVNDLTNLSVVGYDLDPLFNKDNQVYVVQVPYQETSIELAATTHPKATLFGTGIKTKLAVGDNLFEVYAISEAGTMGKIYQIIVKRAAPSEDTTLSILEFYDRKDGTLFQFESVFNPLNREYIINLPNDVNIMSGYIVAEATDPNAIVFNSGYQLLGGFVDGEYHTILTVSVQAESGKIENYRISVYRNVDLSDLTDINDLLLLDNLGGIHLTLEGFNESILTYNIKVPYNITMMNLTVNSQGIVYGAGQKAFNQSNVIEFNLYIVSQNTMNQTPVYRIIVTKDDPITDNKLNSLTINGVLVPNFNPDINTYEMVIPTHQSNQINLFATSSAPVTIQGLGNKVLESGINTYSVNVIAQNGEVNTYTVIINYVESNALLETLLVRGSIEVSYNHETSTLYNEFTFDPEQFEYVIIVDPLTKWVQITGTAQDVEGAQITGFGTYPVGLTEEKIRIYVKSASGLVTETYVIRISKVSIPSDNALLKTLTVGGTDLKFVQNQFQYKINVGYDVESVTISAEAFNPNANIEVQGITSQLSNQVSINVNDLEVGKNVILVKVIAEDGQTVEYYQVTIVRDFEPDLTTTVLLIVSLILWLLTILIFILKRNKVSNQHHDDVIF